MKSIRGFSLVELMAVIGIAAAGAAMGLACRNSAGGADLSIAESNLVSALTQARLRALSTGLPTAVESVIFNSDGSASADSVSLLIEAAGGTREIRVLRSGAIVRDNEGN